MSAIKRQWSQVLFRQNMGYSGPDNGPCVACAINSYKVIGSMIAQLLILFGSRLPDRPLALLGDKSRAHTCDLKSFLLQPLEHELAGCVDSVDSVHLRKKSFCCIN